MISGVCSPLYITIKSSRRKFGLRSQKIGLKQTPCSLAPNTMIAAENAYTILHEHPPDDTPPNRLGTSFVPIQLCVEQLGDADGNVRDDDDDAQHPPTQVLEVVAVGTVVAVVATSF